jgi:hypothetical protein
MPRQRTALEYAAGKLISSIQKEWSVEAGEPQSKESEAVVDRAHLLLQAAKAGDLRSFLGGRSISDFLGSNWVRAHPRVRQSINALAARGNVSGRGDR